MFKIDYRTTFVICLIVLYKQAFLIEEHYVFNKQTQFDKQAISTVVLVINKFQLQAILRKVILILISHCLYIKSIKLYYISRI